MVYRNKTFANNVVVGLSSGKVELSADSGDLLIKSGGSTTTVRPGLGVTNASPITIVANKAALPLPPTGINNGALYFASATNELFLKSGGGWYRISLVNTSPSITLNKTTATIGTNLTLDVNYTTVEPEGTPVTVALANSGIADTNVATITHTTSNNNIRVVFDGTTSLTNATVTATVTDGVNTGVGTITINTSYVFLRNEREALTLVAENAPGVTDVKQQSLYLPNGDADVITIPASSDLQILGGAFTVEAWLYPTSHQTQSHFFSKGSGSASTAQQREYSFRFKSGEIGMYWSAGGGSGSGQDQTINASTTINLNEWFHFACTMDSSNNVTLYKNGTSVGTGSFSGTYNTSLNKTARIGRFMDYTGISHDFHGYISNLRIVKGSVVYSSNFTPPTSPLTAITNTVLLTAQGSLTDHSSVGHTLTSNGGSYNELSPFAPAGTAYNNKFVRDSSDSAHTLSFNGTVAQSHNSSLSPYRTGGYSGFIGDGSSNYVTYPSDASFVFGTGDFTVEAWVFPENVGSGGVSDDQTIFGGFATPSCLFFLTNTNSRPALWDSSSQATSSIGMPERQWTHIAWARSSGTLKIFVNGEQGYSGTYNTNFNQQFAMYTGKSNLDTSRNFSGHIADLRVVKGTAVYTSEFTPPARLTAITNTSLLAFNTPYNRDMSTNKHTITYNGDAHNSPFSPFARTGKKSEDGGSFVLNNAAAGNIETTDSASNEIQLGSGDFTIEFWYNPDDHTSFWEALLSKRYATTGGWRVYKDDSNGYLKWYRSTTNSITTSSAVLYNHTWTHIAVVKSGSTMKIYANGIEKGSASDTYDYTTSTAGEIEFGAGSVTSELPGEGHFADLRIVVGTAVYTGEFTPPSQTLTKTGGTYPSTTNVNTSFSASHTKLLLNFSDNLIKDLTQSKTTEISAGITSALNVSKFTGEPTIRFDTQYAYIDAYRRTSFGNFGTRDFTIETFFYKTASGQVVLFDTQTRGVSGSQTGRIAFMFVASGGVERLGYFTPGTSVVQMSSGNISLNTWYHAVWYRINGVLRMYLDGTPVELVTSHPNPRYPLTDDLALFNLGIGNDAASGGTADFVGNLENTRIIFDHAQYPYISEPVTLTTTNSGMTTPNGTTPIVSSASNTLLLTCHTGTAGSSTITDGSSNNTSITAHGNAVVSDFGPAPGMKSVYFDGTGDYLSLTTASALGTGDWTVEYWVYHNDLPTGSGNSRNHVSFGGDTSYSPGFYYMSHRDQFGIYHAGSWGETGYTNEWRYWGQSTIKPVIHKWYHMAYVHRDSTGRMQAYMNGANVGETAYTGDITSAAVRIGGSNRSGSDYHMFNGYISNVRIIKGQALYDKTFTPPARRFV